MESKQKSVPEISHLLDVLSAMERGDFSKQLEKVSDPVLGPIVEKLNAVCRALEERAQNQSEVSLLQSLVENIPLGVFIKDAHDDFRIKLWNSAAEKIFEVPKDAILGKATSELLPKEQAELYTQADLKVVQGGVLIDIPDEPSITKSRGEISLHTKKLPLKVGNSARAQYILCICEDITEKKKAGLERDRLSVQLHEAQAMAKIGSWDFDLRTMKLSWTSEHYRIFEIQEPQSQERLYSMYRERIHPDDLLVLDQLVERAKSKGEGFVFNHRLLFDGGSRTKRVQGIGRVKKDSAGVPFFMSGTCQDLTDLISAQEENQFVLDALQIGVWKFNPVDKSLFWDKSMYRVFDIREEDFSGHYQAWESTLTPEARIRAVNELEQAIRGEKEFDTVFEIQTKSRGKRLISGRGKVIRNANGDPVLMYGVNIDVTEQELQKRKVIENEAQLSVITDNFPGLISRVDREGRIAFANRLFEEWLGVPVKSILGKPLREVLPPDTFRRAESYIKRAMAGERVSYQGHIKTVDGRSLNVFSTFVPYLNADSVPEGFFAIEHDITAVKQAEAKLIHSSRLASLGEMSAGIAHEINNPLAIIDGSVSLLNKFAHDPKKFDEKVDAIRKAVARVAKIVTALRKFSRTSIGSDFTKLPLARILTEAIVLTEIKANRHGVSVSADLGSKAPVLCDEVELEQVFVNLINNAIDAVKNQKDAWVRVRLFDEGAEAVVRVEDSGRGIPPEIEQMLFQPFFTTKDVGEGTGLGLSISKGILDQHHASIAVLSGLPNTCFEIRFKNEDLSSAH